MRAVVLSLVFALSLLQNPPDQPEDVGFTQPPPEVKGDAALPIQVATPMAQVDFDRLCVLTTLAAPQRVFAERAFDRYRLAAREIVMANQAALWQLTYAAAESYAPATKPDYPHRLAALSSREDDVARALASTDEVLFNEVESVLSDVQKPLMARVRARRDRQRCFLIDSMVSVMDVSRFMELTLTTDEIASIDEPLAAYETTITPLQTELHATLRRQRLVGAANLADMAAAVARGDEVGARAQLTDLQNGYAIAVKQEIQISRINNQFAKRIRDLMPPDRGLDVLELYYASAYQPIFPDSLDVRAVVRGARSLELPETVRASLNALYDGYLEEYLELGDRLIEEYDKMREFRGIKMHYPRDESLKEQLRSLRDERWSLDNRFVLKVRELVNPSPGTDADLAISAHQILSRQVQSVAKNDRFPYH